MIQPNLIARIEKLSIDDRVLLANAIWEGVAAEVGATPLTGSELTTLNPLSRNCGTEIAA